MFGLGWEDGSATIVARQSHEGLYHAQAPSGLYHHTYDYVVDVQPDSGGPIFRATFTELFTGNDERTPEVGEQARVKFHAKSQKVKLDRSVLREEAKTSKDAGRESFEAIADAGPGGGAPAGGVQGAHQPGNKPESFAERSAEFAADAAGFAERAAAFRDRAAAGAVRAPSDPLDRLQKLADLHDRGVLTDAEFAAEKAKLIGS